MAGIALSNWKVEVNHGILVAVKISS